MTPARPFLIASTSGMVVGFILLFAGIMAEPGPQWFPAHGAVMLMGWVLMALFGLHAHALVAFATGPDMHQTTRVAATGLTGAILLSIGHLLQPSGVFAAVALLGATGLLAAGVLMSVLVARCTPRGSVVHKDDPLTKGDDACWMHVKFAHRFLPLGLLLLWVTYLPYVGGSVWGPRLGLAGMHLLLIGYGLLSLYGLGHLWVPRFSGVPAIAAGAIKGELHTTLLGVTGVALGFLFEQRWLILATGPFVFLGFFTYMGVLGANIMRNKSITQRVTPEFVYVPWTFAGIFWLVSGVLLGLFLHVVPDTLRDAEPALRWIHIHINLFGGFVMLIMGWATRIFPAWQGAEPPLFAGGMKAGFLLLNIALAVGAIAHIRDGPQSDLFLAATLLVVLGLLFWGVSMRGFLSSRTSAELP